MIKTLTFHRFKTFKDQSFDFRPNGISLIAGGNNSGKSSILQGLAVWQFCKTAIEMERGSEAFLSDAAQGLGLGDDEFSPINVPALNHLWTNLKSRKDTEPDGYTLKIGCEWNSGDVDRECELEFGLALANDRLFLKTTRSNLQSDDKIPRIAYLPPFAGITDREMRQPIAIRRRRIGEGLAGAVLRNILLDMYEQNLAERARFPHLPGWIDLGCSKAKTEGWFLSQLGLFWNWPSTRICGPNGHRWLNGFQNTQSVPFRSI